MHQYGIDVDDLQNLIRTPASSSTGYGSHATLASTPEYRLEQFIVDAGKQVALDIPGGEEATLFVEEGSLRINGSLLGSHKLISLPAGSCTLAAAIECAALYVFYGPDGNDAPAEPPSITAPEDYRDKYWGTIQTMVNKTYTGKRLFFRRDQHSSLHFHCNKTETYFLHSGELYLRLRAGRGEDRFFTLHAGNTLFIPPGLMHQDGARADAVIIEISTHDEDSDSFIVEDGARNRMPGLSE